MKKMDIEGRLCRQEKRPKNRQAGEESVEENQADEIGNTEE